MLIREYPEKIRLLLCSSRTNDLPIDPYHSLSKQKILPVEPLIQCEAGRAKTMQRQSLYSPRTPKWPPSDKRELLLRMLYHWAIGDSWELGLGDTRNKSECSFAEVERTIFLPITSSDVLPLSYRRLVGASTRICSEKIRVLLCRNRTYDFPITGPDASFPSHKSLYFINRDQHIICLLVQSDKMLGVVRETFFTHILLLKNFVMIPGRKIVPRLSCQRKDHLEGILTVWRHARFCHFCIIRDIWHRRGPFHEAAQQEESLDTPNQCREPAESGRKNNRSIAQ